MANTKKKKGKGDGSARAQTPPAAAPQPRALRNRTITARAAASIAQKVPVKPRFCRTCQKPRAGHPKQCTLGPSSSQRLDSLEQASLAREQESMDEEVAFLARSDAMDTEPDLAEVMPGALHATQEPVGRDTSQGASAAFANVTDEVALCPPPVPLPGQFAANGGMPDAPEQAQPPAVVPLPPAHTEKASAPTPVAGPTDERLPDPGGASANLGTELSTVKGAAKASRPRKSGTDSDGDEEADTEPLLGGLKSTPAGDLPLRMKRSPKNKDPYPPRAASKKATEMFKSMAVQGDLLCSRVPGWAFCMFVPMERKGEMRSWSSGKVRALVPDMPAQLRQIIFEHLEPFREQADDERELLIKIKDDQLKETESELERYKHLAADAQRRAAAKEREADELRSAYAAAQQRVK